MPTTIITKYGVSPGVPPLPSELAVGEVATNHEDGKIYTKKADGTVIELGGGGGGDPGVLPAGTDGDMLFNNALNEWAVTPKNELQYADNPDKPGQRELQLFNLRQLTQYATADTSEPAVELIGDDTDRQGLRVWQQAGIGFGIEIGVSGSNLAQIRMRKPGDTSTSYGIELETGATGNSYIDCDGPIYSRDGTSEFAGIIMEGTNAGINMQDVHRVFNHPDPSSFTSTNVANARWVNTNFLRGNTSDTFSGSTLTVSNTLQINGIISGSGGINVDGNIVGGQLYADNLTPGATQLGTNGFAGIIVISSSMRYKENIEEAPYGLDAVMALEPKKFNYINDVQHPGGEHLGFLAEDIEQLMPELAVYKGDQIEAFNKDELVPVLVKAIQELKEQVDELQKH